MKASVIRKCIDQIKLARQVCLNWDNEVLTQRITGEQNQ